MKFNFTLGFFFLLFLAMAFMSSSGGRATAANSGNCGAPGDGATTCITCHGNSNAINVEIGLDFKDADGTTITNYVPGEVYDGSVTIKTLVGNPAAYGFQAVALAAALDENGDDVAGFSEPSGNAQIATVSSSGRQYVEHNGPSRDSVFTFKWTAPVNTDGPVSIYACGNGVNLNGGTSGDNAACTKLEFQQRPVSARNLSQDVQLTIAPNPVGDALNLLVASRLSGSFEATIYGMSGRQLLQRQVVLTSGQQQQTFGVAQLKPGVYVLRLANGRQATAIRFVKE